MYSYPSGFLHVANCTRADILRWLQLAPVILGYHCSTDSYV